MKILIFLFLVHKLSAYPVDDDRIIFLDSAESVSRFSEVSSRIDDSTDDLKLDLQSLFNDPNVIKSENDTDSFMLENQGSDDALYGQHYQGDIVLSDDQKEFLKATNISEFSSRTGIISLYYRWPKNRSGKVIVPYEISNAYSILEYFLIGSSMRDIEKHTCISFTPRKKESDYIFIQSGDGCSSHLGKIGSRQVVNLDSNGCMSRRTIIHELVHALGFDHMQSRYDRDRYIDVLYQNIKESEYSQFELVDPKKFNDFNTPYDYYSIMHYGPVAFSKNRNTKRTIVPKIARYRNVIGQSPRLSLGDIKRINNMYNCGS
ncbi:hatching enzyme 1.2-like [Chironomus tepperi]|uniref:hatching enzyme 1.2-like n=1 Tax=Chironomus tepperi TaxID=113505 RepID=UPI00391F2DBC